MSKYLIWAAGEFQYPTTEGIPGLEHCSHTATIGTKNLKGKTIVIGGYESGIDRVYHLAERGKHVQLFDMAALGKQEIDPSVALST